MATLSVITLESFSSLPNWSDIFKYIWTLIEYYQKDKMAVDPPSFGSYGDASSIGHKNVCSMDDNSNSNSDNGSSGRSTPCSFIEVSDPNLSEIENLNKKIEVLQRRIQEHDRLTRRFNDPEIRAIASRADRNINLDIWQYWILVPWQYWRIRSVELNSVRFLHQYYYIRNIYGYNAALDDQVNKCMISIRRASAVIDRHNQRIQVLIAENQNIATSQSQDNSANSSNNDNNN
jgi:hypothetical protein